MKKTEKSNTNEIIEIPAEEAPYALPDGWKWVRLGDLYEVNPKNVAESCIEAAFIPMEKIKPGMVSEFSYEVKPWGIAKKGHTQFADGDVAFAKITPCFENRKSMMLYNLPNGIGAGTTELIVLRQPNVLQKYTFWLINSENFINGGKNTYSGTVGQQRISMDFVKNYPIPLPPLETQKRIVERIESLFAKLDEAKEKAQTALDTFELRKSAILHKAFTGELTAQWRSLNSTNEIINELTHIGAAPAEHSDVSFQKNCKSSINLLNSNWEQTCLKNIVTSIKYGCSEKSEYEYKGIPVLRIPNIGDNGSIDFTDLKNLISNKIDSENLICENDILIIRSNGSRELVGKCALVPKLNRQYAYASFLIRIRISKNVYPKYLVSYLNSSDARFQLFSKAKSSSGIHNINSKELGAVKLSIPPLPEQQEIVRILDDLLAKENAAKEAAEAVIEKIDLMKKSILARAFRGEL